MMKSCGKCKGNSWHFSFKEGWVTATCRCGNQVKFPARKKPSKKEENCLSTTFVNENGKQYLVAPNGMRIETGVRLDMEGKLQLVPKEKANFDVNDPKNKELLDSWRSKVMSKPIGELIEFGSYEIPKEKADHLLKEIDRHKVDTLVFL